MKKTVIMIVSHTRLSRLGIVCADVDVRRRKQLNNLFFHSQF